MTFETKKRLRETFNAFLTVDVKLFLLFRTGSLQLA
jgi:hypothetical protein